MMLPKLRVEPAGRRTGVSAVGRDKSNLKWFCPTTSSLTRLPRGFQRQLPAQFVGARNVSTRQGRPGTGQAAVDLVTKRVLIAPREPNEGAMPGVEGVIDLRHEIRLLFVFGRNPSEAGRVQAVADASGSAAASARRRLGQSDRAQGPADPAPRRCTCRRHAAEALPLASTDAPATPAVGCARGGRSGRRPDAPAV